MYLFPANVCPALSTDLETRKQMYADGPSIPNPLIEGLSLRIKCEIPYFWADGTPGKLINCSYQGNWTEMLPPCLGSL